MISFPSLEFFQALQARMLEKHELFQRLGYFDTTFGVRVLDNGGAHSFILGFEVFENVRVEQVGKIEQADVDFVLEGPLGVWREMLDNIRRNRGADAAHSLNTLTHFGESLRSVYLDPDAHDKMYRFAESIQQYFNLAAEVDLA